MVYDFHRLNKVKKDLEKKERSDTNSDNRKKNKLREPLEKGEKVSVFLLYKINWFKVEPVYIYFDEPIFDDKKIFILRFSKNNEMKKVLFSTKKDYFITSMKCFLKLDDDKKNWKSHKRF